MGLPYVDVQYLKPDPDLPEFPAMDFDKLVGMLDAAHATDLVK